LHAKQCWVAIRRKNPEKNPPVIDMPPVSNIPAGLYEGLSVTEREPAFGVSRLYQSIEQLELGMNEPNRLRDKNFLVPKFFFTSLKLHCLNAHIKIKNE
jgi:hypothetical protein